MTATGHAIIGTVIATKIGNPALAIPLAFISHIIGDLFPHWDEGTNGKTKSKERIIKEALIDVILGFALSYLLIFLLFPQTNILYAFLIIVTSQLLDWLTAPWYFFGIKPFKVFYKFQKMFDNRMPAPWGIINQVAILALLVLLAKIF
ncbi:MAG: hypothetical protein A2958_02090 [Candidatus Levybacteria bacterium RIFCSPLOWO2_01_FULL_38_13]|nr:MAG: hypothetical protein A2629_02845 [Candidatus Levybacteria bacterium RIFCSPHIGHO2_01_FULL_41_15]OGH35742.1 MAG: hypothetical protein A2958_02090 [Candidatus Levybacteria bacterium RIFCSPLOWO2_01_FULL_38_13]